MKNLIIGMAFAAALAAAGPAEAATTIVPKPASPPAVSSGTAQSTGASGTVSVTPSSAPAPGTNPAAAPGGNNYPACAGDISAYCGNLKAGRTVDQCLDENAGRLSTGCKKSRSGQK